jgi:hypothetical protein
LSMCQEEIRRMVKDEMIKGVNNGYWYSCYTMYIFQNFM